MGGTGQCGPSPGKPFWANKTSHAWGLVFAQGLSRQPHCGIPLGQSLCVQLAKPAEKGSLWLPCIWLSYIRHLFIIWGGFTLTKIDYVWEDWSVWIVITPGFHPSLVMIRLRVRSTCWAQCQAFDGHAGNLLTVLYRVHNVQIATVCLYGAYELFEGSLLHSLHCCCCDLEVSAWAVRHAPQPGHSQ